MKKLVGALRQMGDNRTAQEIVYVSGTHHNFYAETEFKMYVKFSTPEND